MNRKPPLSKPPTDNPPKNNYIPHPPDHEYPDSGSSRYRRVRETSFSKRNAQVGEETREATPPYQNSLKRVTKRQPHPHHIARNNTNSDGLSRGYSSESDEQEAAYRSGSNSRTLTNAIRRSRMVSLDTLSPPSSEEVKVNQLASLKQKLQSKGYVCIAACIS